MVSEFDRSLAVVIGINQYQNGIAHLQTAVPDAVAIATILQQNYQYQLIHPDFGAGGVILDHYATIDRLKSLFTETIPQQIRPTEGDRLLVYFAGHGIARSSDTGPEGYLIPQDGSMNNPDTLLRMGDLHHWLSKLQCRHLLVILDCCFAGSFRWASTRKLIPIPEKIHWEHYYRFIKYPAWQVITSAAHNQEALDFLNNRDRETTRQHSPFASGLIQALGEGKADLIPNGVITTPELYLYLRDYVELNAQERQTPGFFPLQKHDRGEYIFKLPQTEPKLEPAPPLHPDNNPYRGLESFDEKHSRFFFGRQAVVDNLFTRVTQPNQKFTVVLGISGSGKSSLVKAGLIPLLRKSQTWHIVDPIRPGTNSLGSLARALESLNNNLNHSSEDSTILSEQLQQNPHQLIDLIQSWSQQHPNCRLLIIIDQFEELITQAQKTASITKKQLIPTSTIATTKLSPTSSVSNPSIRQNRDLLANFHRSSIAWWQKLKYKLGQLPAEYMGTTQQKQPKSEKNEPWQEFIALLNNLLQSCPQLSLVVTLRSDFEPRFLNSALQAYWSRGRFVVPLMQRQELRDAVEKPATEMALYFEPADLVDRLVDEVVQMPGALPLLSFTLSQMYIGLHRDWLEEGKEDRALCVDAQFDQQGGVAGSLTRRANQEYNNLPDNACRQTMGRVMLRMVEIEAGEAVRRRVTQAELQYADPAENQRVETVLQSLDQARLIVGGEEGGEAYVEPAHDFLVRGWDRLQDWLQQGQQQEKITLQRLLTPAATDWHSIGKSPRFLWNANPRLELLDQILHSELNWFNRVETEFIQTSVARKKFNRRSRWTIAFTVIVFLGTGLIVALLGQRQAKIGQSNADKQAARVSLSSQQSLEAMLDSLRAGRTLQDRLLTLFKPPDQLLNEVTGTLQWSVYQVQEINRMQGDTVTVRSTFNPDSNLLASAEENGMIRIWNRQGKELAAWQADPQRVWQIAFHPSGDLLASAEQNGMIHLWNLQGEELAAWQGDQGQIRSISFSPDGGLIATAGGTDGTVKLWNLQGQLLTAWQAHSINRSVAFSRDGSVIATVGENTIRFWNLQGELLQEFPVYSWRVVFSPDGEFIASAGDDGFIRVWNRNYEEIAVWQADNQRIWNVTFSPDSRWIASGGEDGSAKVWDLQGRLISEFNRHNGPARSVSFSKDGKILASAGDDGTTRLWSLEEEELSQWQGDSQQINSLIFNSQGKSLVSGSSRGIVRWNLQGKRLNQISTNATSINSIDGSADGKWTVAGSQDGRIYLGNLAESSLQTLSTTIRPIESIAITPDGGVIAVGGGNGIIQLWNLQTRSITQLSGHTDTVYSLRFSPDGKLLASAGSDGLVIAWDWQKGQPLYQFQDHIGEVYSVAFSPNSKWLASGGEDRTIRLYNLQNDSIQSIFQGYEGQINAIAFRNDQQIFSGDSQGFILLWDVDSRQSLATWQADSHSIDTISLNPQGNILATAGETGKIKLWRIDSFENLIAQVCTRMQDYLQHNSRVEEGDRTLCQGVSPVK